MNFLGAATGINSDGDVTVGRPARGINILPAQIASARVAPSQAQIDVLKPLP